MANSAPWADHRSSGCSGHCALGRLCSDVVRSAKFHMGHRPTVPGARRPARPDYYRRVRIPLAVPSGESGEILILDWTRSRCERNSTASIRGESDPAGFSYAADFSKALAARRSIQIRFFIAARCARESRDARGLLDGIGHGSCFVTYCDFPFSYLACSQG